MTLSHEDKLILSSIKINPSVSELEQIDNLILEVKDWDYLTKTIIDRGIAPLLFKKLPALKNSSLIPDAVQAKLQQTYYITISRGTLLLNYFQQIAKEFSNQGIPVIALKGVYLSENLYHDIGLRQFSDIDLLVHEEDGERCLDILRNLGYRAVSALKLSEFVSSQFDIVHYTPMVLHGVSIEIHIKLHRKGEKYNLLTSEVWKNAMPVTVNKCNVLALENNDLLIHLCAHLDKHFQVGKVQFTCLSDITNVLNENVEGFDWGAFTASCRLYKSEEVIFKYIVLVNKYMNAPVPIDVINKYSYLLTEETEQQFFKYLKGVGSSGTISLSSHFYYLKEVRTFSNKVRYLLGVLFPPKDFMIERYKVKYSSLVVFYYPLRWTEGIRGVVFHLKKSWNK
ncbi:hypothetical protein Palpr_1119 [Paludibacter propionicigenes WB4]|uniref:Nucleotidyltransferase family protein n=1 Tax=Paludibacter propionicigenes (strain DSM 17365 / JCM 13257 / WB4) TaxID=694427 RepID=E4T3H3_PALPW|nr:nucleotidyltransferase family protein [Paludibacter propionicigenes]ADQ79267.1 hypothetical protein Palpr_1119 [Paludibacter propionicigenes WB4]